MEHEPYSGVKLTELGARLALVMIRRHRLIETFLVETLGYTWDEIHTDADLLEHAASDRFINRIDALLDFQLVIRMATRFRLPTVRWKILV